MVRSLSPVSRAGFNTHLALGDDDTDVVAVTSHRKPRAHRDDALFSDLHDERPIGGERERVRRRLPLHQGGYAAPSGLAPRELQLPCLAQRLNRPVAVRKQCRRRACCSDRRSVRSVIGPDTESEQDRSCEREESHPLRARHAAFQDRLNRDGGRGRSISPREGGFGVKKGGMAPITRRGTVPEGRPALSALSRRASSHAASRRRKPTRWAVDWVSQCSSST